MIDYFRKDDDGGVYLTQDGMRIYIRKLEMKFRQRNRYLNYVKQSTTFRRAIEFQVNAFARVLDNNDINAYDPIRIR